MCHPSKNSTFGFMYPINILIRLYIKFVLLGYGDAYHFLFFEVKDTYYDSIFGLYEFPRTY